MKKILKKISLFLKKAGLVLAVATVFSVAFGQNALEEQGVDASPVFDANLVKQLQNSTRCSFLFNVGWLSQSTVKADFFGELTPYWAQEMVGSDLARDLIEKYDAQHRQAPSKTVPVEVLDIGLSLAGVPSNRLSLKLRRCKTGAAQCFPASSPHGTNVTQLIVGMPPMGASSRAQIVDAGFLIEHGGEFLGFQDFSPEKTPKADSPYLVSASLAFPTKDVSFAIKKFLELESADAVLVLAAGNDYPRPVYITTDQAAAIIVGSVAANGLLSVFSQESDNVTLAAPSNFEVQSASFKYDLDEKGYRKKNSRPKATFNSFSGTSGATPLVTAALADAMSLLGKLTLEEAKLLLKATAQPAAGFSQDNKKNGAGVLNTFKLMQLAVRLKKAGWPENRAQLLDALKNQDDRFLDFSDMAFQYQAHAKNLLAKASKKDSYHLSCDVQQKVLGLWRRAYLLAPANHEVRHSLASYYDINGFHTQAGFFRNTTQVQAAKEMLRVFSEEKDAVNRRKMAQLYMFNTLRNGVSLKGVPKSLIRAFYSSQSLTVEEAAKEGLLGMRSLLMQLFAGWSEEEWMPFLKEGLRKNVFNPDVFYALLWDLDSSKKDVQVPALAILKNVSGNDQISLTKMLLFFWNEKKSSPLPEDLKLFCQEVLLNAVKEGTDEQRVEAFLALRWFIEKKVVGKEICADPVFAEIETGGSELVRKELGFFRARCNSN